MPSHTGRWERTPFRASMRELFEIVQQQFGWTLESLDRSQNPERTWGGWY
jgi:hypothetical protein